ncbi:MAG: ParA family protein [Deltaproteobacteria bacterium]|nr:ParA family protein [Deltaproteobacteria bacterium]
MRIISVLNQKGGVGKTTLVANLGAAVALARPQSRVLLVDLDPQAQLTCSLGQAAAEAPLSVYGLLAGRGSLAAARREVRPGLDLVPASLDLAAAEGEFAAVPGREYLLRGVLQQASDYDFVFLDCPPNLGLLSLNSLAAAGEVLIPLQAEFLALQSLGRLWETVAAVRGRLNPGLTLGGIVATRFDGRKRLSREVLERVAEHFGALLFRTRIRENVSLAEAPSHGQDIFAYRPASRGAQDYRALGREFLQRGKA